MRNFLESARSGSHPGCQNCPWNPKIVGKIAFGLSCLEHGIDWSESRRAVSIQVVQDPAGTTPDKTGRLCFVHNSQNPTDKTAQHAYDLWRATVSYNNVKNSDPYLKTHYWTNAILHGADKKNTELRKKVNQARRCCEVLLNEQVERLSPKVIIANGEYAANSLYSLGYTTKPWSQLKEGLGNHVYSHLYKLPTGEVITVFCTYHTAITAVNTHVARLFTPKMNELIHEKLAPVKQYAPIKRFLDKYPPYDGTGKGMMVLLFHWLEIGEAIRSASGK